MQPAFPSSAYSINNDGDTIKITIPIPKTLEGLVFEVIGLIFCVVAGVMAFVLFKPLSIFLWLWICLWAYASIRQFFALLRILTGKEIIEISDSFVRWRYQVLGLSFPQEYQSVSIYDICVLPPVDQPYWYFGARRFDWWRFDAGSIAFYYGAQRVSIAHGLCEKDALGILGTMKRSFPQFHFQV